MPDFPMDTVPRDGTEILVYTVHEQSGDGDAESFSCWQIGHWEDERYSRLTNEIFEAGWWTMKIGTPVHWMPLPDPPTT